MNRKIIAAALIIAAMGFAAFSCGSEGIKTPDNAKITQLPCSNCSPGTGGLQIGLWAAPYFDRLTVNLDTSPSFTRTFDVTNGTFVNQQFVNIPVGTSLTLTLQGKPAVGEPDEDMTVASATVNNITISAGQITYVSGITVQQLWGRVSVTASFPENDFHVADIAYIEVTFTGQRVPTGAKFYLGAPSGNPAHAASQDSSLDNKIMLPYGGQRYIMVKSFTVGGLPLHQNIVPSLPFAVYDEDSASVIVQMLNTTGEGRLDLTGGSCTPDCTGKTCGSDGCTGVCGGCRPDETCDVTGNCAAI